MRERERVCCNMCAIIMFTVRQIILVLIYICCETLLTCVDIFFGFDFSVRGVEHKKKDRKEKSNQTLLETNVLNSSPKKNNEFV